MKILKDNNNLIIEDVKSFNIMQILECGQCFRFYKIGELDYLIIAHNRVLRVEQKDNQVILYNTSMEDFEKIWSNYLDIHTDYNSIKETLLTKDSNLIESINVKEGIRILKQDTWETLISFIISQNKQITHIKQVIENLSKEYGTIIGEHNGVDYYSFPTPEQLAGTTDEALRNCKTGFRAPYILDTSQKVASGEIDINELKKASTSEAREKLISIKGVGNKIADCVLLYGLGRTEVFPTDVWIKRIVEHMYLKEESKLDKIQEFAATHFGELAGYAQQYLFYYGRENKIGK
ncbi:N-glycosylase/DNA lyase [Natranaerovirga pectinivora]|uniref:DNA-(apurinic or apyrimidinic site) lyase n=1 Tax=Natranaerovirga pectinivora TaxID=682400 RepID=A0A4R3MSD7_9FIRM|nr:DNA-3-methyladenine glycosylase [Natranaerovirga pectinivora]TCT15717.1 N-glycosylase/DNA lyase [Natranaerovirga pectinivora]